MAMALEVRAEKAPLETDRDGVVRVGQTRVTLDTVVAAYAEGATAEEIVQQYPTLMHGDTYAVIAYYLRRQIEVDDYLRERAMQAAAVRRENETRFDPQGVRERLLSRRAERGVALPGRRKHHQ
jgi:uncharacterized protein (DUF433 family)